jgi:VWFA-related protein
MDGRRQSVRYYAQETALPLTFGLLVDSSASQRFILHNERTASAWFLEQVLREDKDQAFIAHFANGVALLQDLTPSRQKLSLALARLDRPMMLKFENRPANSKDPLGGPVLRGVGTSLYDVVQLSSDKMMKKVQGRKALIMLTDGVDSGSRATVTEAMEAAQRADTLLYSILFADENGYPGGRNVRPGRAKGPAMRLAFGKKTLQRMSQETGGSFYAVSKKLPIEKVFEQIQEELRNQYSLGYTSDRAEPAGFRRIRLATKAKALVVQTRNGYYAAP